jgi:hypothetical protein
MALSKIWQSIAKTDGAGVHSTPTLRSPVIPTLGVGESYSGVDTVQIPAAAVATLNATPVEVLAAPGAGLYYTVEFVEAFLDHQGVDYDAAASGDTLVLKYTDGSGAALTSTIAGDTFGGASADAYAYAIGVAAIPVLNAKVVAHINTGEWYSAAGDGIVNLRVHYTVRKAQA